MKKVLCFLFIFSTLAFLHFFDSFSQPYQIGVNTISIGQGDTLFALSEKHCPNSLVLEEYIWFVKQSNKQLLLNQKGYIFPGDTVYLPRFEEGSKVEIFLRHFSNDYYNKF